MPDTKPKSKLRWYQFSLRTLLLFVTVFAICCWPAARFYEHRKLAAIRRSGGGITSDRRQVCYFGKSVNESHLVHLKGLTTLERLDFSFSDITDAGLVHLKGLTSLQYLNLYTQITHAGLVHLKELTSVRGLYLYDTQVTKAGLDHLRGLANLQSLALGGRQNDADLVPLKELPNLRALFLDCQITDAGLEHLRELTDLRTLRLITPRITDAGLERLKGLTRPRKADTRARSGRFRLVPSPAARCWRAALDRVAWTPIPPCEGGNRIRCLWSQASFGLSFPRGNVLRPLDLTLSS